MSAHLEIGMDKWGISTPALLIDLDVMEKNISEMVRYFKSVRASLRPHTKIHYSPIIARKQLDVGGIGICCHTVGETEVMASSGINNILITNEIVGRDKIERLINVSGNTDVIVAVDNPENAEDLSAAALKKGLVQDVLLDLNIGLARCGVLPGKSALSLAKKIVKLRGLRLRGIMGYHSKHEKDFQKRKEVSEKMLRGNLETKELLEKNGIRVDILSGGCTNNYNIVAEYPGMTEVQAGTYVFMDLNNSEIVGTTPADLNFALTVLTTVISRPTQDRAVVDAGRKAIAESPLGYAPKPKDIEGVELYAEHAEHGLLRLDSPSKEIKVGDKLELIVAYCDGTVNLWRQFCGIRNGRLEAILPIHHYGLPGWARPS